MSRESFKLRIKFVFLSPFVAEEKTSTSLKPICEIGFICLFLLIHPFNHMQMSKFTSDSNEQRHQGGVAQPHPLSFPPFLSSGGRPPPPKNVGVSRQMAKLTSSTLTRRSCPFMSKCGVTCHQMWRKNPNGAASPEKCVSMNCN